MHSLRRNLTIYVQQLPDAATYLHDDGGYRSLRQYIRPTPGQQRWVSNLSDGDASSDTVDDDVTEPNLALPRQGQFSKTDPDVGAVGGA